MADDQLLKAPDFALIEDEAGPGTAGAVRNIWLTLLDKTARIERGFQRNTADLSFTDIPYDVGTSIITGGIIFDPDASGSGPIDAWLIASGNDPTSFWGVYNISEDMWGLKTYVSGTVTSLAPSPDRVGTYTSQLGDTGAKRWDALYAVDGSFTGTLTVGTLSVTTFTVSGNMTVGGTLTANAATITTDLSVGDDLVVTGDASIGATLGVTGAITGSSTIHAVGNLTTGAAMSATTTVAAGSYVTAPALYGDILSVTATGAFGTNVTIGGTLGVTGDLTVDDIGADQIVCNSLIPTNIGTGWIAQSYSSGYFAASAGSWTVDSGDVGTFAYSVVGKTMFLNVYITNTTVTSTPVNLILILPGGYTAGSYYTNNTFMAVDNGARAIGYGECPPGATYINLYRYDGSSWSTSTNATYVLGQFVIPLA